MNKFLIPSTGQIVEGTFEDAARVANGAFYIRTNADGNTCMYNGNRQGHSTGFCTANPCY